MTSPSAAGQTQPKPCLHRGSQVSASATTGSRCRAACAWVGRVRSRSKTAATMVHPMVQRSTAGWLPKSRPPSVSRISTMDKGYRNMSTGVE